jgi:hypothetical protein
LHIPRKGQVRKVRHTIPAIFDVKFVMQQTRYVMSLDEFCKSINVPNVESWEEIPSDSDEVMQTFWRSISVDVPNDIVGVNSLIFNIQG